MAAKKAKGPRKHKAMRQTGPDPRKKKETGSPGSKLSGARKRRVKSLAKKSKDRLKEMNAIPRRMPKKDHTSVKGTQDQMVTHETGALRSITDGKGRFDLLSFFAIRRLALHMENGLKKYAVRNWEKGIPLSRFIDAAMRHLMMAMSGMDDEDHMAAAFWNIHGFIHTQEMIDMGKLPKELDDMHSYGDVDPMIKRLYGDDNG